MLSLPLHNKYFETLYKEFNVFIQTKNYKQGKGKMIQACVREFLFFIETKGFITVLQIKTSEIIAYYEYIRERPNQRKEGGLSDSMIRLHVDMCVHAAVGRDLSSDFLKERRPHVW